MDKSNINVIERLISLACLTGNDFFIWNKMSAAITSSWHTRIYHKHGNISITVISVSIPTKAVSSNLVHREVYSIQHYMITFVGDLE